MVNFLRLGICALASYLVAKRALKRKSLDFSGAVGALIVGTVSFYTGLEFGFILMFFFFSSSKLTKYKSDVKEKREENHAVGGQRNWAQVLANGGFPTLILVLLMAHNSLNAPALDSNKWVFVFSYTDQTKTFLITTFICSYVANCADTWASEVGIVSNSKPRYILAPWRVVEHGTNGGFTMLGYSMAVLAGVIMGVLSFVMVYAGLLYNSIVMSMLPSTSPNDDVSQAVKHGFVSVLEVPDQWPIIFICIFAAFFGTTLDSILGALLEPSYFCKKQNKIVSKPSATTELISGTNILSGGQINFVSGAITGIVGGLISVYCFHNDHTWLGF